VLKVEVTWAQEAAVATEATSVAGGSCGYGSRCSIGGRGEISWLVRCSGQCRVSTRGVREGHRERFEELTLLQTEGSELCLAIVGPAWVRNHLSEGMRITALHHTEMVGELAIRRVAMSSAVELVLGCSPDKTFWVEAVGVVGAEFQKLEERFSRLERPSVRICDMLLGPRARLADCPDEPLDSLGQSWLRGTRWSLS
jgi:hypothetical protein